MIDTSDYAQTVVIDITAEDIAQGVRESCESCPAALAARRAFPGHVVQATVSTVYVELVEGLDEYFLVYTGGSEMATFTNDFDRDDAVQPISITLTRDDRFANFGQYR